MAYRANSKCGCRSRAGFGDVPAPPAGGFLYPIWNSFASDIGDLFSSNWSNVSNPNPAPTPPGVISDVVYNAFTGKLTSSQVADVCQQTYNNVLQAGGTAAAAQAAYNECKGVATQPTGGTNLLLWLGIAVGAIILIKTL